MNSRRTPKPTPLVILFALAVAAGAVLFAGCGRGDGGDGASGSGPGRGGGPGETVVSVAPVTVGTIARSLTVSGILEPIRTIAVNSRLAGALTSVLVEEGTRVKEGDVLARVDDREIRSQIEAAEAAHQVAESAFERATKLRDRQVITLPEYERDRTALAAAKAELDQLRTRLGYATVRAPITGVVTEKRVEAGDIVAVQTRLFALADVATIVTRVRVSELDVVHLHARDAVRIELDAFPGRVVDGVIRRIFPTADPATRLVPVEVALEGEAADLGRPGFLARVTFALGVHENVKLVPASAVVGGGRADAVFVVENGKATRRTVATGLTSQGSVEILSGLEAGEQVVTAGNHTLPDGAAVRVVETPAAPTETGR